MPTSQVKGVRDGSPDPSLPTWHTHIDNATDKVPGEYRAEMEIRQQIDGGKQLVDKGGDDIGDLMDIAS